MLRKAWVKVVLIILALLLAGVGGGVFLLARRGLPVTAGVIAAGVEKEVEIYRDGYGVPHIIARTPDDLFFAQGYVHAQDRLWQMDMTRRGVSGKLSEILGPDYVDIDRFALTVGFYRAAGESYDHLVDETKKVLAAYARGVNAFIEDNRRRLPLEFTLIGYRPALWDPLDTLAIGKYMAWYLGGNMNTEILLSALIAHVGEEMASELFPEYPAGGPVIAPGRPAAGSAGAFTSRDVPALVKLAGLGDLSGLAPRTADIGSNNWVVSGSRTGHGAALLANDMHLGMGLPNIWYANHLILEGEFNVTGVMFTGVPGVIAGCNEHIAWGFTNTGPDVQDLYLISLNPDNPHQYRYLDRWEDARVLREQIRVKGEAEPREAEVLITRHGPVISAAAGLAQPLALRWTALEPTGEAEAVLHLARARNWEQFLAALEHFMAPTQNIVYADRSGNIGFRANGLIPIRKNGRGLLPVDGSTDEFAWESYIPWAELPTLFNPPEGIIVTANHRVVDESYPYFITSEWATPYRALGIWRELDGRERLTLEDMARAQTSFYNTHAEMVAPLLVDVLRLLPSLDDLEERALQLLYLYSCEPADDVDSPGAAIFHAVYMKLLELTFADEISRGLSEEDARDLYERLLKARLATGALDRMLLAGESGWFNNVGTPHRETRDDIIAASFQEALAGLKEKLGPDPDEWRWGALHTITFSHDLGSVQALARIYNRGPFPVGGSAMTPAAMSYPLLAPFGVTHSAPWRFMVDLHDHAIRDVLSTGISGHPFSPHYDDQMPLWLAGEYKSMPFTVEECRALPRKLVLRPH